jgi:antitoxin VapB
MNEQSFSPNRSIGGYPDAASNGMFSLRLPSSRTDDNIFTRTREPAMPLNIRNEAVNLLAKKLAVRKHVNKTEAVKMALENELRRIEAALPLRERLRPLQQRVLARPATGLEADKAFFNELSGNT